MSTPLNKQAAGIGARWKGLGLWARTAVAATVLVLVLLVLVLAARWLVSLDSVQSFLTRGIQGSRSYGKQPRWVSPRGWGGSTF